MRFSLFAALSLLAVAPAWRQMPGQARDIAIGSSGVMWVIGAGAAGGGFGIHRWSGNAWVNVPGGAVRIAVDGSGYAWVVNEAGNLFRYNGAGWDVLPGLARDIGGGGNQMWIVGTNPTGGGYGIYRWTGSDWANVPGGAERIAVDPSGNAWVVNDAGSIFRWTGRDWQNLPGQARDIGVGADGTVWVIGVGEAGGGGYGIFKWTGGGWDSSAGGAGVGVTVDQAGRPFIVARDLSIWMLE